MTKLTNKDIKFIRKVETTQGKIPDLNNLDLDTVETPTEPIELSDRQTVIELFEESYKNATDLTLFDNPEGKYFARYSDPKTEVIFRAFKVALKSQKFMISKARGKLKRNAVSGPYIIGMEVADNTVQFGFRPYKHKRIEEAVAQAKVLSENHKHNYTVFAAVDRVVSDENPQYAPVEETRQKEKGRIKASPTRVFTQVKEYVKDRAEGMEPGTPTGINVNATSGYIIELFASDSNVKVDTFEDVVKYFNNWLHNARHADKLKHEQEEKAKETTKKK